MSLTDRLFGNNTNPPAGQPNTDAQFNQLKQKYASVLQMIEGNGQVSLRHLHVQDGKLFVQGTVANDQVKNKIWDQIKAVDPSYSDLTADLVVDPALPQGQQGGQAQGARAAGGQTYSVQPGDTLSKISKQFYGDANKYMEIFNANRDKLNDPNKIQVGQQLTIPPQ